MVIYPLKLGELAAALDFLSTFIHRLCTLTGQTQTLRILHIISISSYHQIQSWMTPCLVAYQPFTIIQHDSYRTSQVV